MLSSVLIIVDKLNELLVYPHITFMRSCTKLVKCDYLTQKKFSVFTSKYTPADTIGALKLMLNS